MIQFSTITTYLTKPENTLLLPMLFKQTKTYFEEDLNFKFQEVKITTALSFFEGYIYGEITNSKNSPTKVGVHLVFSWEIEKRICLYYLKTENTVLNYCTKWGPYPPSHFWNPLRFFLFGFNKKAWLGLSHCWIINNVRSKDYILSKSIHRRVKVIEIGFCLWCESLCSS